MSLFGDAEGGSKDTDAAGRRLARCAGPAAPRCAGASAAPAALCGLPRAPRPACIRHHKPPAQGLLSNLNSNMSPDNLSLAHIVQAALNSYSSAPASAGSSAVLSISAVLHMVMIYQTSTSNHTRGATRSRRLVFCFLQSSFLGRGLGSAALLAKSSSNFGNTRSFIFGSENRSNQGATGDAVQAQVSFGFAAEQSMARSTVFQPCNVPDPPCLHCQKRLSG